MSWPKLDPAIIAILLDGAEELAVWAWHKVSGDATNADAKKAIARMRARAAEAAAKAIQDELEQQAAIANLTMQLVKLGSLAEHAMREIEEAERRAARGPHLLDGVEVEVIPPDQPMPRQRTVDEMLADGAGPVMVPEPVTPAPPRVGTTASVWLKSETEQPEPQQATIVEIIDGLRVIVALDPETRVELTRATTAPRPALSWDYLP